MEIVIFALIAAFFAWRLFSTLGTRHEEDRQRPNPFAGGDKDQKDLLALPLELPAQKSLPKPKGPLVLSAPGPAPQSLSGILHRIAEAEPGFDEKAFVKGARLAFEMIVHAFAASELGALKPLVSPVLYDAFKHAIDARAAAQERVDITLLNVIEAHIVAAEITGAFASITLEFISDQARAHSVNGVATPPESPQRMRDTWTFRRALGSSDPNWMLVETRSA